MNANGRKTGEPGQTPGLVGPKARQSASPFALCFVENSIEYFREFQTLHVVRRGFCHENPEASWRMPLGSGFVFAAAGELLHKVPDLLHPVGRVVLP